MKNVGQCCIAVKRIRIADEIADAILEKFQAALLALRPRDSMDPATTLAPLSTESALPHLLKQIQGAVAKGAKVLLGGC